MRKYRFWICVCFMNFIANFANAQSINIGNFYYRDYLDFGQNKGIFKERVGKLEITGKNGEKLTIPNSPNFSASSNNGNLTAVGRGFTVTANHVTSPENPSSSDNFRKWGLTTYTLAKQDSGDDTVVSVSKPYGRDEKFLRFDKYIVEGHTSMLDIANSTNTSNPTSTAQESQNLADFKDKIKSLADSSGNVYIYQAGSGVITLRGGASTDISRLDNGETKGGGFGILNIESSAYLDLVKGYASGDSRGITFTYSPNGDFNNRITSGDSGSGIYAYDSTNNKWILLGVASRATTGVNRAEVSFVSNKDFADYQSNFEQQINLKISDQHTNTWSFNNNTLTYQPRGDTPQDSKTIQSNKDLIFSGGGAIQVASNINRNISGYAGGFVFVSESSASSANPTKYIFTNANSGTNGGNYYFKGSGLDIGENVEVEWHLRNDKNDALHKIGKGTLVIKTDYTPDLSKNENLGYLKIGEGKVTLDTSKKAFEGIYITSGRGELSLVNGKAEALGATQNNGTSGTGSANSYTLAQGKNSEMGFYFGSGGGKLDLGGNSLTLNTIAANDSGTIITNASTSAKSTLEIEGLGYDTAGNKSTNKADTIIHASIGEISPSLAEGDKGGGSKAQNGNPANIDIKYNGNSTTQTTQNTTHPLAPSAREGESSETLSTREGAPQNAHLVFDGHINTSGSLSAENANIALQGHASTHATISDSKIREQIKNAENGTSKAMPDYMDLSKPSTLNQPDWDTRYFKFSNGIELKGANLTLGRNAYLESNISADSSSSIAFGGGVKHFIDNKDSANINGEGFGYYQKVESGNLSAEMQNLANQSTHYKGKITADGTTINSSIFDFNASLDLKNNAKLNAEYLTLTSTDSVTLANGASATIQNLVLKNVSDLNGKFSVSGSGTKFEVQKSFQFENSNFDLSKLDSTTGLSATQNYDIVGVKSTITGTTKDLSANVELYDSASLSLKNLTLKNVDTNNKNLVYLQGGDSQTSNTKLSLSENLQAQNLDKAQIILWGKSEISTPKIEFSSVKEGVLLLDSEAKLTNTQNANVEVKGVDSGLNIFISGNHNFNINASGANTSVTLNAIPSDFSPAPENKPSENAQKPSFSGKISARDSSIVTTALESITASVDLSGNASLVAKNITLDSTHNSIDLKGTSSLNADTISAKNLTNLTLNLADNASASVSKFIFDGGENGTTTNLVGNLIGTNIELKNASIVKAGDLHFKNKGEKTTLTLDNTSKLEANTLKIDSTNLWLNLADSATNTASLQNIDLQGGANLHINAWDFGNNTIFKSADNSRVIFHNATYTQNSTPKSFSAATTISGTLSLTNVGSDSSKTDDRFNALTFSENLSFGESAKIMVNLDSSIYKNSDKAPTLDTYYTLLGAKSILDNRADKRIDFIFDSAVSEDKQFFVVSKFFDNELRIKFLESNPRSFSELNKHISSANSKILQALSEHNPHNENIDIAARTEEYAQLESFLSKQQETMSQIAKQASGENLTLMLQNNDLSMRLRVMQALFASSQNNEQYAQNHIKQKPILLAKNSKIKPYNATKSDYISTSDGLDSSFYLGGVPKPPKISNANLYKNNAWASALGGYVGTSGVHNAFYGSSVGYDRIINKTLLGVMASFGGHTLLQSQSKQNGIIASGGVYLHTVFSKSEFSSSLSYTFSALESNILGDTIKSSVYGGFWSNYYKYNVGLLNGHILKPLIAISIGANKASDWRGKEFRGGGFSDVFSNIGAGLEYMLTNKRGFYTLGLVGFFKIHSQSKAQISFANAKTMLDVVVNHNAFETQGYFIGSHSLGSYALQQRATLEYGIYASIDGRGYYGVKGNVVFKYAF